MTFFKTFTCASALAIASASIAMAPPVAAQSKLGTATANYQGAVLQSNAFKAAKTQIDALYAADIQAVQTRAKQLDTEIKGLVTTYNTAVQAPNATQESVRPAAEALQKKQQDGQQELARMSQRVKLAEAYAREQIELKLEDAIRAAMKAKKVDVLLQPDAVIIVEPYVDITAQIVTEINRLVPSVNYQPPADYKPGSLGAGQPQAQQAAQPSGR